RRVAGVPERGGRSGDDVERVTILREAHVADGHAATRFVRIDLAAPALHGDAARRAAGLLILRLHETRRAHDDQGQRACLEAMHWDLSGRGVRRHQRYSADLTSATSARTDDVRGRERATVAASSGMRGARTTSFSQP